MNVIPQFSALTHFGCRYLNFLASAATATVAKTAAIAKFTLGKTFDHLKSIPWKKLAVLLIVAGSGTFTQAEPLFSTSGCGNLVESAYRDLANCPETRRILADLEKNHIAIKCDPDSQGRYRMGPDGLYIFPKYPPFPVAVIAYEYFLTAPAFEKERQNACSYDPITYADRMQMMTYTVNNKVQGIIDRCRPHIDLPAYVGIENTASTFDEYYHSQYAGRKREELHREHERRCNSPLYAEERREELYREYDRSS